MYPEIDEIDEIIGRIGSLELDEKTALKEIFKGLKNRQEKLFGDIKEQVIKETQISKKEFGKIYTLLVDSEMKSMINEKGFYEICDYVQPLKNEKIRIENTEINKCKSYSCGIVFWNRQYELLNEILTKKYNANIDIDGETIQTKYYFEECNDFIDKEKDIHKLALQYGIEKPVIYNPMARRALRIFVEMPFEISRNNKIDIDFKFDKNKLQGRLILDSYLVWNIMVKGFEDLPPAKEGKFEEIVPLWDKTFLKYKFQLKHNIDNYSEYILINNDIRAIKIVDNAVYWQLKNNDYSEMTYKKYTIYKIDEKIIDNLKEKTQIYYNYYQNPVLGEIERIRTKGDAERCIACFNELKVVCLGVDAKKEFLKNKAIYTYSNRNDYYQIKDERLRSVGICRVCFKMNKEDMLFVDKISYILGYLNHRYPEYQWIGVC